MKKELYLILIVVFHVFIAHAQPDQSKPVGSIHGQASVSPNGAASYSIPIPAPVGIAGLQPALSLVYSSQGGDDLAGWGWSLNGLSAITRGNQAKFYNGKVEPLKLNADDNFYLEGQLLMPVSGTNGGDGTQYKTQTENYSKVESFGGTAGNPLWWRVTQKNGSIIEYGKNEDAKLSLSATIGWLVSAITDVNNNKINFTYSQYDAEVVIYQITYASTIIRFSYVTRANQNLAFINGRKLVNSRLLSQISILQNNVIQQKLQLTYETLLQRNYLTRVDLFGTDNTSVVTKFNYGQVSSEENAAVITGTYPVVGGSNNWTLTPGDYNGDGRSDLVVANLQYNVQDNEIKDVTSSYYNLITNVGMPASSGAFQPAKHELQASYNTNTYLKGNDENHPFVYLNTDLDGDGIDDAVRVGKNLHQYQDSRGDWHNDGMYYIDNFSIDKFTPSGTSVTRSTSTISNPVDVQGTYRFVLKDANSSIQGDFDGDGSVDIINVLGRQYQSGEKVEKILGIVYRRTPIYDYVWKGFFVNKLTGEINAEILNLGSQFKDAKAIYPIDFDGDGKQELLVVKASNAFVFTITRLPASSGYLFNCTQIGVTPLISSIAGKVLQVGDFNGDKKTDVLSVYNNSTSVRMFYSTGTAFVEGNITLQRAVNFSSAWPDRIVAADYNGDGLTDILHAYEYPVTISTGPGSTQTSYYPRQEVYYMKGLTYNTTYTYNTAEICESEWAWFQSQYPDAVIDSYSPDLVCATGEYVMYVNYNFQPVDSYTPRYTFKTSYLSGMISNFRQPVETGDFNGDGKTEVMQSLNGTGYAVFYFSGLFNDRNSSRLQTVTDGFGNITTFNYNTLANGGATLYTRSANSENSYPFNTVSLPITVVSTMSSPNGIGGTQTNVYQYRDAIVHRAKGLLGFKGVTVTNSTFDTKVESNNILNSTHSILVPASTKSWLNNTLMSEVLKTFAITTISNGSTRYYPVSRYKFEVQSNTEIDQLSKAAKNTTSQYDAYSNITSQTVVTGYWTGSAVSAIETAVTTTTYQQAGKAIFPLQPTQTTTTNTRNGSPAFSKTTAYTYTADRGLPLTKTVWSGTPLASTITYSYDPYGNVTGSVNQVPGKSNVTTTITIDASRRFPVKNVTQTGAVTVTKSVTYHSYWGKPLTETEGDGSAGSLTTTYEYDGFGALKKTITPLAHTINHSRGWDVSGNQLYYSLNDYPDGVAPDEKTWYDKLGRVIKKQVLGWNNQWTTETTKYDARGRTTEISRPYYSAETPQLITYAYDNLNRIITQTTPLGSSGYTYNMPGNGQTSVTVTNAAGQASTQTKDATGLIISAADNGGQLTYTYNSQGNQTTVLLNQHQVISGAWDNYGRQVSVNDANLGSLSYEYDALGHLTKQTDANGDVTTLSYDDLERVLSKTTKEGTTTYEYYNTATNKQLKKVTGTAVTEEYNYDAYQRLTGKIQTVSGTGTFTTTYQYNAEGNQSAIIYPNNVTVQSQYNTAGMLTQVTSNGKVLYNTVAVNGLGQATQYTLVNGKTSTATYENGLPTRLYTPGVQDLNFVFNNQTGNLTSRRDAILNLTETFEYDNLNRLTSAAVNTVQQFAITYDAAAGNRGNITQRSDVGTYVYQNNKPNAIAYISPLNAAVDANASKFTATYTSFQRPLHLDQNGKTLDFSYGVNNSRIKTVQVAGGLTETRLFLEGFERQTISNGTTNDIIYVAGGNGLCAMIVNGQAYAVYKDYLGSILTVTNEQGTVVAQQNFDAWGRKRNALTWEYNGVQPTPVWLVRGYTGHEHLPQFGLINMNARLYDPTTGRMLSPDPYIMGLDDTQGYNRFAYALNNPLKYTDPNGEVVWFVPIIFAAVNVAVDLIVNDGDMSFGQIVMSAVSGAISGWLGGANITTVGGALLAAGVSQANRFMPAIPIYESENFTLSVSPMIGYGTSGFTGGASLNASGLIGDFAYSASVGIGFNSGVSSLGEAAGSSNYWYAGGFAGYYDGNTTYGAGYSYSHFSGKTKQGIGAVTLKLGDVAIRLDEDYFGDGKDRSRTGGLLITFRVNDELTLAVGGSMITGEAQGDAIDTEGDNPIAKEGKGMWNPDLEKNPDLRGGTMYFGVIYRGQAFFLGHNSEKRLHAVQNWIHRNKLLNLKTPYFPDRNLCPGIYSYYGSFNPYYLYY
ncbi:hypothetical protein FAM09_26645 [Niastella caeni]|uniref:Bacterial toxin 23 domain-containing protein n=1 Tax=Niastella caeni TaxID=2569763 RepID=A0A4S8HHF7_9BACT|nr:polymorphic toxin type 23 domain-containing protein [Niastella caeni]THU33024.1 hypothetical protein FAM09_26645 [Niastella caeni]